MTDNANRELTITRELDAPRELVFKAWTDAELVAQWWGPNGFTSSVTALVVKPGGAIDIVMEDTEGIIKKGGLYPMSGKFQEVVEPERLVFISSPIMDGKAIMDSVTTVTFEEVNGKTKLTVHVNVTRVTPEAEMPLAGMEMGWNQQLDRLPDVLKRLS